MSKKKALFLALIGILTTSFLLIPRELPAQADHEDDVAVKEEPSDEIKQLYKELESEISKLEKETASSPDLKAAEKEIEKISLILKDIQPKVEPETAENWNKIKLDPDSRALINKKRELQTKLHTAGLPLQIAKDNLAALLKKKKKLEAEYFLVPVETPILAKTASELKGPTITVEGEVELRHPDDISITLVLSRTVAASAFCEVYLNNTFIKRERWKIGPKGEFTATIAAAHKAGPRQGLNYLAIILNTGYQEDDVVTESPPFEKNPLVIFNESKIAARNLVAGSFKLRREVIPAGEHSDDPAEDRAPVEDSPEPPSQ